MDGYPSMVKKGFRAKKKQPAAADCGKHLTVHRPIRYVRNMSTGGHPRSLWQSRHCTLPDKSRHSPFYGIEKNLSSPGGRFAAPFSAGCGSGRIDAGQLLCGRERGRCARSCAPVFVCVNSFSIDSPSSTPRVKYGSVEISWIEPGRCRGPGCLVTGTPAGDHAA